MDSVGRLRQRVQWLNSEGGFAGRFCSTSLAAASRGVGHRRVMDALSSLAERRESVEDPTAWACRALRRS